MMNGCIALLKNKKFVKNSIGNVIGIKTRAASVKSDHTGMFTNVYQGGLYPRRFGAL